MHAPPASDRSARLLAWLREHTEETVALIAAMVERESPSDDASALEAWADWFASTQGLDITRHDSGHLECRIGPRRGGKPLLVLGHYDTVWPLGTLATMPFLRRDGRIAGPGVLDMKAGIAIFLAALQALRALEIELPAPITLLLNADEEVGSRTSRPITETCALASHAVLVLEPGTGLTGKLKTARKGIGDYRITVHGRASHAGVDFEAGASAILELSRLLLQMAEFVDPARGITLNPGVIAGGTRSNVVAAEAWAHVDVRIAQKEDAPLLDAKIRALQSSDKRCRVTVTGGWNRPPMERSHAMGELFALARQAGESLGLNVEESSTGGGSDGNFAAALGVPVLDGLGAVGEGAHAPHESILEDRLADRAALLALLLLEIPCARLPRQG